MKPTPTQIDAAIAKTPFIPNTINRAWMAEALSAALSVPAAAVVGEPVAWQPRYKQEVIDHHRSQGADFWEYAMTVYPTKEGAEGYGYGGHEARPLYPAPPAPDVMRDALSLVIEYDDLLRHWEGPEQVLLAGDVEEIDAAYDKMVAACRAALGGKP